MKPGETTIGRYFRAPDGVLWLHEYHDKAHGVIDRFLRADDPFNPETGQWVEWQGSPALAELQLMDEPILETLAREQEEREAA